MKETDIRNGDIVRISYREYYTNRQVEPYDAVVLWKGINCQPLLARLDELEKGEYRPVWSVYEHIAEVRGHINFAEMLTDKMNEHEQTKEENEIER